MPIAGVEDKIYSDPALYDLDYDGLIDLLVSNQKGRIMHYKQKSVNSNQFFLVNRRFCNIDYGGYATICIYDIDQDSMPDLFMCSAYNGVLIYEADTIGSLNFRWKAAGPDVGVYASPSVSDIDGDGLADLLIGEQMGVIYHYEQMDTLSLQFELSTENFNNIDVGFRATPEISDLDNDGLLDLLTGNSDIDFSHYEQIQYNSYEFAPITNYYGNIYVGNNSSPGIVDLSDDNFLDLFIGERDGNLNHYRQIGEFTEDYELVNEFPCGINSGHRAAPVITDLENDGRLDLLLGNMDGWLDHWVQSEYDPILFNFKERVFGQMVVNQNCAPAVADFENDGLLDILLGSETKLVHYVQDSAGSPYYTIADDDFLSLNYLVNSSPSFTDFNENDLIDLLIGHDGGYILHYEQSQINSNSFVLKSSSFSNISMENCCYPACADFDKDGLYDLLIGDLYGFVHYYRQIEEGSENFELISDYFLNIHVVGRAKPTYADINGDGFLDVLVGCSQGGVNLYLNNIFLEVSQKVVNLTSSSSGSVDVEILSNTLWNVYENINWIEIDNTSGQNNDIISINYQPNLFSYPRSYTFLIVGSGILRKVTVNQPEYSSSIDTYFLADRINIGPNPCSERIICIQVENDQKIEINSICIYSLNGIEVISQNNISDVSSLIEVDVGNLNQGLHLIKLETNLGVVVKKLIIIGSR